MSRAYPHPLDARAGDLLAVVELEALQAVAVLQVLQRRVRDEQAVVQLQDAQALVAAGAVAQVQDPVIRDELTVRQALEQGEARTEVCGTPSRCGSEPRGAGPCMVTRTLALLAPN